VCIGSLTHKEHKMIEIIGWFAVWFVAMLLSGPERTK
jgi:hypothetical protein